MTVVHANVVSPLSPEEALGILTDFGPSRAEAWSGVDDDHLVVHDQGPDWADVTEGNKVGWERESYTWDAAAGTVTAVTTESNLWAAGSRWDYVLTPQEGGTNVEVTLERHPNGLKGRLIGLLLPLVGTSMIRSGVAKALGAP